MTTFHPQQFRPWPTCPPKGRHRRTSNSVSRIAPPNCAVMFTKREKSSATIFKEQCKSTSSEFEFYASQALPLVKTRFLRLAKYLADDCAESRETVTRWPRNIRQDNRRNFSRHIRAISRQWPGSGNGNAAECPSRRHARQLALRRMRTRHVRAGNWRNDLPQISTMTFKNYEYANHINARSRRAAQGGSRVPTYSASRPVHQFETRP